ncbi:hypothetical protein H6F43_12190 [Leptolyngbya sp. FACHB-36]|uniref:hypothetical protein n=1 Tax=Leptolyngbya sp. FACHB-36 TaxID=2692808 RepID=UPI0016816420|nr:hypothetical protein [Leptolyngbya sp. FACHB-36]MBD2020938.1 hypothetical protein [Leptolyngbya sp. FACHB-36]
MLQHEEACPDSLSEKRLLPNMQRVTVARFVKESGADGYAVALRRLDPTATVIVVFDAEGLAEDDR